MNLKMNFDSERGLILLFLLVSGGMFLQTWGFGSTAGLFPRLTAGVVLVGAVLLLVQNWLPPGVRAFVAEPSSLIQTDRDFGADFESDEDGSEAPPAPMMVERELDRPVEPSTFTAAVVGLYVLGSFLFGMLWVTPVFAAVYSRWFKQSWPTTAFLVVLTYLMAYGFMTVLNLPLNEGQLFTIPLVVGV
ncbi:hypothetical protein DVK02_13115 [Halobellus sp. Atlit-31R]|nr:hypothetical protein DVK02_13115 [Halobellus sp. Atlit-31R]